MQALILATGEAHKLAFLTGRMPAPMLPIVDRPVMTYPLELLARAGCRDIGVALHRMGGCIEDYFGTGSRWGARISYILQPEALGSAGALRWAASELAGTVVVVPAEMVVDFDLGAALAFHRAHGGLATAIGHMPHPLCPIHPLVLAPGGTVASLDAGAVSPDDTVLADTGIYIFEPQAIDLIAPGQPADCHADLLPALMEAGPLPVYVIEGYWNPLETVAAYQQAQLDALASVTSMPGGCHRTEPPLRYSTVRGREMTPGIVVGRRAAIHPAARLTPPVYIGDGCQIERGVELGPGAVIGANVFVDEDATIRNSSVLDSTYVGRLVKLDGRVVSKGQVADTASGETLAVVDPFLLGDASPQPLSGLLSRVVDGAGALLLVLLWSPVIALAALALLLASLTAGIPGRILRRRRLVRWRRTRDNGPVERETYQILTFRTRRTEREPLLFGRTIEQWQIDRLPALWNVLTGDLRLVGPRPLDPADADRLVEEWQRLSYERPAGFTGLWYVQAAPDVDQDSSAVADAYYLATRGFLTDLRLLLRTSAARPVCLRLSHIVSHQMRLRTESGWPFAPSEESGQ